MKLKSLHEADDTTNQPARSSPDVFDARSIEDIWNLHLDRMASYGFTRLLYVFTRFRTAESFGRVDDMLLLSNLPVDYLKAYFYSGLCLQAPMLKWAARHDGAQSWRLIAERAAAPDLTETEREVMALNARYGIRAGYSIGFRDISVRAKGGIGLSVTNGQSQDEVDAIWDEFGEEILTINNVTHLRITVHALRIVAPRTDAAAARGAGMGRRRQDDAGHRGDHGADPGDGGKTPAACP